MNPEARRPDWQEALDVNLIGAATLTRHAVGLMERSGGGSIILVASLSGLKADAGYATYSCSNAALLMLVRSLAIDFGGRGIRANAVSPGPVDTDGT